MDNPLVVLWGFGFLFVAGSGWGPAGLRVGGRLRVSVW